MLYSTVASKAAATFGMDLNSEPVRSRAIQRARDENAVTAAQNLTLRNPIGGVRRGFLFFVPVYKSGVPIETDTTIFLASSSACSTAIAASRRATDVACGAQPALKDRFQVLFNMTLLGNALLARLDASGRFDVVPFQARGRAPVVEVYPGHLMRSAGLAGYKGAPAEAIDVAVGLLHQRGISLGVNRAVRAACEVYDTGGARGHDHDAADALVAACGAILYRERRAREIGAPRDRARAHEGAIWSV